MYIYLGKLYFPDSIKNVYGQYNDKVGITTCYTGNEFNLLTKTGRVSSLPTPGTALDDSGRITAYAMVFDKKGNDGKSNFRFNKKVKLPLPNYAFLLNGENFLVKEIPEILVEALLSIKDNLAQGIYVPDFEYNIPVKFGVGTSREVLKTMEHGSSIYYGVYSGGFLCGIINGVRID